MKCPHCMTAFHDEHQTHDVGSDHEGRYYVLGRRCPECERMVLEFEHTSVKRDEAGRTYPEQTRVLIRPKGHGRPPCPTEVPEEIANIYNEACAVLPTSEAASAALSRKCLEHLLDEHAGFKGQNLAAQIQKAIDSKTIPSWLADDLDAIRAIGLFGTHTKKSTNTGEILPVEPGEAEWSLGVLEPLFDFYFVMPAKSKAKRDALDEKLEEAGKPPMKKPAK